MSIQGGALEGLQTHSSESMAARVNKPADLIDVI